MYELSNGTPRRGGKPAAGEPVLDRAFRILGLFTSTAPALTLSELSRGAGLPLSTTFRVTQQLVRLQALEHGADGRYTIGLRMFEMASHAPRGPGLQAIALPFMQDLHRAVGGHVQLAVQEGRVAVLVERLSQPRVKQPPVHVGERVPLHWTAFGLVLLANAREPFRTSYLLEPCVTEEGLRLDVDELDRQLAGIRDSGIAVRHLLAPEPVSTVAAPIRNRSGQVVAALSALTAEPEAKIEFRSSAVVAIAAAISRALRDSEGRPRP